MTTTIKLPRRFATDALYSAGPDVGTPTKVDVGTPGTGFIRGAIAAPQHFNHELAVLTSVTRRPITVAALRLRSLDLAGSTPEVSSSLGVCSTNLDATLVVKGDVGGTFRFVDTDLPSQIVTVGVLTSNVRKVVDGSGRLLAVGVGGVFNTFSNNSGDTWSAGGSTGLVGPLSDAIWDGTQFIVSSDSGGSAHSTNAVAWTLAGGGSDIQDILPNGGGHGLALLSGGTVVVCGSDTHAVDFAKTVNHGVTWNVTGGTIPSPATYVASGPGWLAGNGGSEIYWLGNDGSGLKLFTSTDAATWTLRSTITGLTLSGAAGPKLLVCQNTGLLIAIVAQAFGGFAVCASSDAGLTWTERMQVNATTVHAFGVARGRLFCTIAARLFASDGIGLE